MTLFRAIFGVEVVAANLEGPFPPLKAIGRILLIELTSDEIKLHSVLFATQRPRSTIFIQASTRNQTMVRRKSDERSDRSNKYWLCIGLCK